MRERFILDASTDVRARTFLLVNGMFYIHFTSEFKRPVVTIKAAGSPRR